MSNMESDMIIINVVAKKSSNTIELSVPDDVFNQAERILLKNERGVFCKTFSAEAFGSDARSNTKDGTKINGSIDRDIKCPECNGYKRVSNLSYYAQKRKIARFDIRLNFNNLNQMWVADEDHIIFCDGDYNR